MKSFLLTLIIALVLPSCFIANDLFLEEEPKLNLPLEVVVKDSVYHFIQSQKSPSQKYLSYDFEPMKIIVPQEIKNLEKWSAKKLLTISPVGVGTNFLSSVFTTYSLC